MTQARDIQTVHRILTKRDWKVSTAESVTAGLISATLASRAGSSAYLKSGLVVYNIDAKVELLGVDRETAAACNCVSQEVVSQMLVGLQSSQGSQVNLAISGYAEPYEGQDPFAYYGVLIQSGLDVCHTSINEIKARPGADRNETRAYYVECAIHLLAQMLEVLEISDA